MKNIPKVIYLQIDADGETPDDFNELVGVSWCSEKVNPNDIEFILNENTEKGVVSCDTCKYVLPKGRCKHPQGCEADYELWEQLT